MREGDVYLSKFTALFPREEPPSARRAAPHPFPHAEGSRLIQQKSVADGGSGAAPQEGTTLQGGAAPQGGPPRGEHPVSRGPRCALRRRTFAKRDTSSRVPPTRVSVQLPGVPRGRVSFVSTCGRVGKGAARRICRRSARGEGYNRCVIAGCPDSPAVRSSCGRVVKESHS